MKTLAIARISFKSRKVEKSGPHETSRKFSGAMLRRLGRVLDHYSVLGVTRSASTTEIKTAFTNKAPLVHPERNNSPNASKNFQELMEAYRVRRDPELRAVYDRSFTSNSEPRMSTSTNYRATYGTNYEYYQQPRPPPFIVHPAVPLFLLVLFTILGERNRRVLDEEISENPPAEIFSPQGHFVLAFRNPFTSEWERLPEGFDPPPVREIRGFSEDRKFHKSVPERVLVGYVPASIARMPGKLRRRSDGELVEFHK